MTKFYRNEKITVTYQNQVVLKSQKVCIQKISEYSKTLILVDFLTRYDFLTVILERYERITVIL